MSTPGERCLAARVPGEPGGAVRREAVVEPLEVAAVDLAAVLEAEQARRIEPHPVRLLACRVVLVRMAERALALQVVGGKTRPGRAWLPWCDAGRAVSGSAAGSPLPTCDRLGLELAVGKRFLMAVRSVTRVLDGRRLSDCLVQWVMYLGNTHFSA